MFWQLSAKERAGYAILGVLVLAIIGVLGYRANIRPAESALPPAPRGVSAEAVKAPSEITVDVEGEVNRPGVYRLSPDARVDKAIALAGGAKPKADVQAINRAARLTDGQQIRVPKIGEVNSAIQPTAGSFPERKPSSGKLISGQVSLNSAGADELCQVPGIGKATAARILTYRSAHGAFTSIEELKLVGGIGDKKLARMAPFLKL